MKGKKAQIFFEVSCPKHGKVEANDNAGIPRIKVATPKHSNDVGCPICNKNNHA